MTEAQDMDILYSKDGQKLIKCGRLQSAVTVPEGVREIATNAFSGCEALAAVKIPPGVEYVSPSAFKRGGELSAIMAKTDEFKGV